MTPTTTELNLMSVLLLVAIFVAAIIITFVFLCAYLKLLSVIANKLNYSFHKAGEARGNTKQDSRIEVCCIYCFDKTYHFFYTCVFSRISGVVKYIIGSKPVCENGNNSYSKGSAKYNNTYLKGSVPENHTTIIKRLSTKSKQNPF